MTDDPAKQAPSGSSPSGDVAPQRDVEVSGHDDKPAASQAPTGSGPPNAASTEPASSSPIGEAAAAPPAAAGEGLEPEAIARPVERVVDNAIARVMNLLDEKHALDRFREAQIDRLHGELQGYKSDLVGRAVRPVLMSLVRLHDDLSKMIDLLAAEDPGRLTPERLAKLLEEFREDVELALDRNGVTSVRTAVSTFDSRRHKIVLTIETPDPEQVGQIAASLRPGFEHGGTLIEKERVVVRVLGQPTPRQ